MQNWISFCYQEKMKQDEKEILKKADKYMQRYSITSNQDYLKEQHMMVTKVLKGNTKN